MKNIYLFVILIFTIHLLPAQTLQEKIGNAGTVSEFPNDNVLVVFDSTSVDVQETGLSFYSMHRLYKVLTQHGALDLNVVKIDYDPLSAYVEIKKVVIYRKNGTVENLDITKTLDYPAPARAIYWGAREKMLGVGRLEPGDALEVSLFRKGFTYALLQADDDDKYIPPMKGHFYDIVEFWNANPVLSKVYRVTVPKNKPLQYEFYNGECISKLDFKGERMTYSFVKNNIRPINQEARQVALSDIAPKLLMSTSPDWKAKSLWFNKVNEDYGSFAATPEIKAKVNELLIGATTEIDSISKLTHWCADNIRYSGISMGPGEGFTLHKGEMTFLDRCGVCKDKAGMLITMLRAAGFESYPAMTMAGSRIDYIPADQFNHSVTVVKLHSGKYKMLDPTWVPFLRELWSSAEQQQGYLMGVPEGADLLYTPVSQASDHYFRITGTSEIKLDGSLEGEITVTGEGQSDGAIRRNFTGSAKSDWKSNIEKELLRIAPQAQMLALDYGKDPYDYMAGPITVKIKYRIPDYAIVTANQIIFTPFVASNLFRGAQGQLSFNTALKDRKYSFTDRCSRLVELKETVKLPAGYRYDKGKVTLQSEDVAVSSAGELVQQGQNLEFTFTGQYNKRIYEPRDWEPFRKAVDNQNFFALNPVVLNKQ
jgi:transglutaminase-like putative cysteine protease